jgi:hypothetical protein
MLWRPDIDPGKEPHRVLIKRAAFVDESRGGRRVPFKLYHPEAGIDAPVVLWSHGLGGSADGASFIARFIAAHGYVVVNITHPGTDSSMWEGKPGHPWDVIRATRLTREVVLNRFRDVPFVLDSLPGWLEQHSDIKARPDFSRTGMSGHSFGALTTQVMSGLLFPDENDRPQSFRDERFKAGILYSPVPVAHLTDLAPEKLYNAMDLPLLFITGTADQSPIEGFGMKERLAVYEHAGGDKNYLLMIEGADHMVFAGSRGKLTGYPKIPLHETIIKVAALAWWDAWLKNDDAARAWLQGGIDEWLGNEAAFTRPA